MAIGRNIQRIVCKKHCSIFRSWVMSGLDRPFKSTEYRPLDMKLKFDIGTAFRLLKVKLSLFDEGYQIEELFNQLSGIDPWFLYHIQ